MLAAGVRLASPHVKLPWEDERQPSDVPLAQYQFTAGQHAARNFLINAVKKDCP